MNTLTENFLRRAFSGIILVIWILAPYVLLQQFAIRDIWWLQPTAFDYAIPINFHSLWFYYTFYLLLGVVGLSIERPVYLRYLYVIGWTTMVAHMIFLLIPNGLTRIEIHLPDAPVYYHWLANCDAPRNAFPSLHVALSVVAGIAACSSARFNLAARTGVILWILGIIWSTIALRQHVIIDGIAGAFIASIVWLIVGRVSRREFDA
jgi:membrane-associated phospholipid phosphatase